MLAFIPVVIVAYRQLPPRLWPVMQVLVAHVDRDGRCWPSVRRIAEITGVPRSTVSRYLTALERAGHLSRTRKPGGVYIYRIAAQFLPSAVSQRRDKLVPPQARQAVPSDRREEKSSWKKTVSPEEWRDRIRFWRQFRGAHWNPLWGPRPDEPGFDGPGFT